MPLLDQIQKDMIAAMKSHEELRLDALRMIKTALKKHEVDSMKPLDESTELQILNMLVKQRHESADMFRKGNRPELADKEEAELKIIESYMPSSPTEAEMDAAVAAAMAETGSTSIKQMGVVMKAAQAKLAGKRVDGKALSDRVRSKLSNRAGEQGRGQRERKSVPCLYPETASCYSSSLRRILCPRGSARRSSCAPTPSGKRT